MDGASPLTSKAPMLGRRLLQVVVALAIVLLATFVRAAVGAVAPGVSAFAFYYPAVLAAALLGGVLSAAVGLGASLALGWRIFGPPPGTLPPAVVAGELLIYLASGALVAYAGARLRWLLRRHRETNARIAERELHYRTLFESVTDGFALVEAIRDAEGRLVDYTVLEANPALLRMLQLDARIVGQRYSEILRERPAGWLAACDQALKGAPVSFSFQAGSGRWIELHLSRVSDDRLAQFAVDITDQKMAERRQVELFDELNHRVKNNLAMVSAMLGMQARTSDQPQVRDHLAKAVDRIQTIADIHASLYRASSTDEVDFAGYLQDLCERLSEALLSSDRVRIKLNAEPSNLALDKAVALGLVVNELVTNAVKHAYPGSDGGTIEVMLRHAPAGLVLSVCDSGRGLSNDKPSTGLGMRLVRSLVQQLEGRLEISGPPGARFDIHLPQARAPALAAAAQSRLL